MPKKLPTACLKNNYDPQLFKALKKFKYINLEAKLSNLFKIEDKKFFAHQSFLEFGQNHKFQRFAGNPYM
jgi:hypothetical protein